MMEETFIILRYADGAVGLTGWGVFVLMMFAAWIGVMTDGGNK